ncbi:MAG: dTMP kinase, partial [Raoultibacter sp.]
MFASQGIEPTRTILMRVDAPADEGLERATHHGEADRLELAGSDFHARVNEGFLRIAAENPDRVRIVVSAEKKSETARAVFVALGDIFPWMSDEDVVTQSFFEKIEQGYYGNKKSRDERARDCVETVVTYG